MHLPPYLTITKRVGETPLGGLNRLRDEYQIPPSVPLAYAGRLDPMASGILLVLIGDECKVQETYHALDKTYAFEVLLGARSDTGDVLGRITSGSLPELENLKERAEDCIRTLPRTLTLPYPHFSSKTVKGKPLHVWTLEGRLNEIEIPVHTSKLYKISLLDVRIECLKDIHTHVRKKIETIPKVTEASKELGRDFRRVDIRADWDLLLNRYGEDAQLPILTLSATVSSGTYIRSLAPLIGEKLNTTGLAYSIHRTRIGRYTPLLGPLGFWRKTYGYDRHSAKA